MHHPNSICLQTGAVTLLTSLMMLLVISAVTFAVGRVAINETRLVSDEQRRYIARMAASAGMDRALLSVEEGNFDHISGSIMTDANFDVYFCDPLKAVSGGSETVDECDYVNSDLKTPTSTDRLVLIASKGTYDEATQYINGVASYAKIVGDSFDAPVIAGNILDASGSATIVNEGGRITVWSRSSVDIGQGSSTQLTTRIKPVSGSEGTVIGTTAGKKGIDIIENDSNLKTDPDELFEQFFGRNLESWKDAIASEVYPDLGSFTNAAPAGFDNSKRRIFYNGSLTISGNKEYGSSLEPIVLIVNGDFDFSGAAKIHGIVFVKGKLTGTGTGACDPDNGCYKINGSVIVGGETQLKGNFGVSFDETAMGPIKDTVLAELTAGGVKDWWD